MNFLDDGGLVWWVTLHQQPPLEASALLASYHWASPDLRKLAVGDLVVHYDHGFARYCGGKKLEVEGSEKECLVLEFARGARLYVPADRSVWVQKAVGVKRKPSQLGIKTARSEWFGSFCLEVLPSAYAWPGIGTFPELPQEQTDEAMAEWHRACAAYQKALHTDAGYRQTAQEYFDRQP